MSEKEVVKNKTKKAMANEIIDKYAKSITINDITPNFTIRNKSVVLNSGTEIAAEKLEEFYWKLKELQGNPRQLPLNIWEKMLSKLFQLFLVVWVILTSVQILGGETPIPFLTGFLGVIPVMIAWAIPTFYFLDESIITRKRKEILEKVLEQDTDFLIAALYNNWGERKTLPQEREVLGKATFKQNKIYLIGGLQILSEDLLAFLKKMKWIDV